MQRIRDLLTKLRNRETGCPWDIKQTMASFKNNIVEEAQELVEAIDEKDDAHICEEVGDTLFNLMFLIAIAQENKQFTFDDVINGVCEKMIERHPHVFAGVKARDAEHALELFTEAKMKSRKDTK